MVHKLEVPLVVKYVLLITNHFDLISGDPHHGNGGTSGLGVRAASSGSAGTRFFVAVDVIVP